MRAANALLLAGLLPLVSVNVDAPTVGNLLAGTVGAVDVATGGELHPTLAPLEGPAVDASAPADPSPPGQAAPGAASAPSPGAPLQGSGAPPAASSGASDGIPAWAWTAVAIGGVAAACAALLALAFRWTRSPELAAFYQLFLALVVGVVSAVLFVVLAWTTFVQRAAASMPWLGANAFAWAAVVLSGVLVARLPRRAERRAAAARQVQEARAA